eukprot:COSAG05_NODE_12667_length_459_cov_0.858333_1_plen_73_part_01
MIPAATGRSSSWGPGARCAAATPARMLLAVTAPAPSPAPKPNGGAGSGSFLVVRRRPGCAEAMSLFPYAPSLR